MYLTHLKAQKASVFMTYGRNLDKLWFRYFQASLNGYST